MAGGKLQVKPRQWTRNGDLCGVTVRSNLGRPMSTSGRLVPHQRGSTVGGLLMPVFAARRRLPAGFLTVITAGAAALTLAAGSALAAPAGGTVGNPQPELAQFRTGPA